MKRVVGEEGFIQKKAMNEVDGGRDRATPASVKHDDDEPLTPISPCYCTGRGSGV